MGELEGREIHWKAQLTLDFEYGMQSVPKNKKSHVLKPDYCLLFIEHLLHLL